MHVPDHNIRLREILKADKVTDLLEDIFGVKIVPFVIYQGVPKIYPEEFSGYLNSQNLIQRDIRIEIFFRTVLAARSWIDMNKLDENFRALLLNGRMTIGQIIEKTKLNIEYRNLDYKEVGSLNQSALFGLPENSRVLQRSRLIYHEKNPLMLIQEYIPMKFLN